MYSGQFESYNYQKIWSDEIFKNSRIKTDKQKKILILFLISFAVVSSNIIM